MLNWKIKYTIEKHYYRLFNTNSTSFKGKEKPVPASIEELRYAFYLEKN